MATQVELYEKIILESKKIVEEAKVKNIGEDYKPRMETRKIRQVRGRDILLPFLVILLELSVFFVALYIESEYAKDLVKINLFSVIMCKKEDIVDMVVSFSAVSSSVVIMFYSLMDSRHFGIPNRTIMRYFLGLLTMPMIFSLILIKLPFLKIWSYTRYNVILLIEVGYTLIQQFIVIFLILLTTSFPFGIHIIKNQERWWYKRQLKDIDKIGRFDVWNIQHIRFIMASSELFSEKSKLIKAFLDLPMEAVFRKQYKELLQKAENKEEKLRIFIQIYKYYYTQMLNAFEMTTDKAEQNQLYDLVYDMLSRRLSEVETQKEKLEMNSKIFSIICGAIMNAAIMSCVEEREAFCIYILNNILIENETHSDRLRNRQIYYYFLGNVWLSKISPNQIRANYLSDINGFYNWKLSDQNIYEGWEYWQIMLGMFSVEEKEQAETYYQLVETVLGIDRTSIYMCYVMQKKRGEI